MSLSLSAWKRLISLSSRQSHRTNARVGMSLLVLSRVMILGHPKSRSVAVTWAYKDVTG
jgi:hypothetical protein